LEPIGLFTLLIIGGIAGWLAGKIVRGYGFGLIGNMAVGIVGALIGVSLFERLGLGGGGLIWWIVDATIGAVVLLVIIGLFRR
jgi:uncharacterized membrane protein YeaQ/YmgE (transglycosylase-associated protein family)